MGILVRLVTSMVGAAVGLALVLALVYGVTCLGVELVVRSVGRYDPAARLLIQTLMVFGCLAALVGGYFGLVKGYRKGLAVGREICAAREPEQHARVDVSVTRSNKS